MSRLRLLAHSLVSVIDQGWLSAINLALGLSLIRWASKDEYGLYSQLFVAALFAVSMTESLLINPMYTLAPRRQGRSRERLLYELGHIQQSFAILLGVLFALVCLGLLQWRLSDGTELLDGAGLMNETSPTAGLALISLSFGLYVGSSTIREFQRGLGFIRGAAMQVLRMDLVYGTVVLLGVAMLAGSAHLSLPAVLGLMAAGNIVAWLMARHTTTTTTTNHNHNNNSANSTTGSISHSKLRARRATLALAWRRGRLGLPGALASWVANYSYLFITAAWLGLAAAAELNASRLLLMPLSLLVVAWNKVARPQISTYIHQGDRPSLKQLLLASCLGLILLSGLYVIALWLILPWLQTSLLGPEYAGVDGLILSWALYFVLYTLHLVGAAVLLSADQYPRLLGAALSSLVVLALALILLLPTLHTQGAVLALIAVEVYNLLLLAIWFLPEVWRQLQPPPSS